MGRCLCNSYPHSSQKELEGYPDYHVAGGLDWFEWSASVKWDGDQFKPMAARFERVKARCQENRKAYEWVDLDGMASVRVGRSGANRGGDRGQHYEFKVTYCGLQMGIANRIDADEKHPNLWVTMSGRDCLLLGARAGYDSVRSFVEPICVSTSQTLMCANYRNPSSVASSSRWPGECIRCTMRCKTGKRASLPESVRCT